MTIVLIAVYVPIGFMSGLTGALFTEFAFTLVGAVTMSAMIALTLSPMMSATLLRAPKREGGNWQDHLVIWLDQKFERLHLRYQRSLNGVLNYLTVIAVFAVVVLGGIYFLYSTSMSELAPQEDQGVLIAASFNAPTATLQQREGYAIRFTRYLPGIPETDHVFQLNTPTRSSAVWCSSRGIERVKTSNQLQPRCRKNWDKSRVRRTPFSSRHRCRARAACRSSS